MIRIEKTEVVGWEHAIRGMRNAKNSWDKSDSQFGFDDGPFKNCKWVTPQIGPNDLALMKKLCKAGADHRKFMRMIVVYCDITAPLYWWKEFDTYKVGTVSLSCSTMHKIHDKEFTLDDFSHEHLMQLSMEALMHTIRTMETYRRHFNETKDKRHWWQIIQLLPTSYNQRRTVMMSYEVLANIYKPTSRRHHKQDEWNVDSLDSFCQWIESLPYFIQII